MRRRRDGFHWRVLPLGRVTLDRCDGPFGSGLKSEHYTESGVRVIRLQNIRSDGFNGSDEAFIDADYYRNELNGHEVIAGDVLIAISGGGNSPNVLKAIRYARRQSAQIIGLLGFDGGEAARLVDIPVIVHSTDYGIIEDVHLAINHMLVEYFKEHLAESRPWIG